MAEQLQLLPTPAARDHKGKSLESRGGGPALTDVVDWGKYAPAIERHEAVFGRQAPLPTDGEKRLNPVFVEWMMTYDEGWVAGVSRTGQLKALGNAIVPAQAAAAWGELLGLGEAGRQAGSSTHSTALGQQRSRSTRSRRTRSQDSRDMPLIPTPTAWLGRREAHSHGDPVRWTNPERSNELSDFVAWVES